MSVAIGGVDLSAASATVAQSLAVKHSAAKSASAAPATGSTSSASATASTGISSSDFLTLLVTEMKNQDPTQPTDPNAYIQQLVGVNSLQQLISINQDLTTPTSTGGSATGGVTGAGGI